MHQLHASANYKHKHSVSLHSLRTLPQPLNSTPMAGRRGLAPALLSEKGHRATEEKVFSQRITLFNLLCASRHHEL